MNGYERYTSMIKDEPVDFIPRTPILMQFAAEYIGSDYAAFASDHRVLIEDNEACAQAGRPFFINAGCEIPPGTPVENQMALCEPISKMI